MTAKHQYNATLIWTGNNGPGTTTYKAYDRSYDIQIDGKPTLYGSSDPSFLGDKTKHNPEELLVAALASCHMLWFLHLCAENGIVVAAYSDKASGAMRTHKDGSGEFESITLRPHVQIANQADPELAHRLHQEANKRCFIARSVNFPVHHEPSIALS